MSQTVITQAFEALKAQEAANGGMVTLDEFVFASVPGLNITDPIDRAEGLPPAAQIVHRQAVSKTGMVNSNAVVYSVVLGADVGDFEFNWVGLLNKASGVVAMIVHAPAQKKIRTRSGQQGNVLTRSFLMEYNGASQQTQIITPADTWQIDFTARLNGVDERIRLENIDVYGAASFINDGFMVSGASGNYQVNKGVAYIAGLRAELLFDQAMAVSARPSKIWVDVCWRGTLTSVWKPTTKLTVAKTLANYVNGDEQHYVFAVAEILANGTVVDLRQASVMAQVAGLSAEPDTVPYFDKDATLKTSALSQYIRELLAIPDAKGVLSRLGLSDPAQGDMLISVQQSLAGAVPRTQHDKNAEWVSLEDFGAVGDGEHDDTEAFVKANDALSAGAYIKLVPGRNYKITGVIFTKPISMGCSSGRASITAKTGLSWLTTNTDLNIDLRNFDIIPALAPNQLSPTWALQIEVKNKNYGSAGFARITDVNVKRPGGLAFYSGIRVKHQPVIIDGGDVVQLHSHTNAAARDGSLENWAVNSGDGILLDSATYSIVRNAKNYYGRTGFRATGQIEGVRFLGCNSFLNRSNYVFDGLNGSANEQRIWGCHGTTYLYGIDMNSDGANRIKLCSVDSCSILAAADATAAQIIYLRGLLDGANISALQVLNHGTRGANDIAISLITVGGVGTRRVMVDGLHMQGVGTGVYLDTNERQHIYNVSAVPLNMVGASPVIYAYGPNNTSAPVSHAFGFPDQENVLPSTTTAPRFLATSYFGLKTENMPGTPGVERFRVRELSSNFRFESADASGTLQYNAGIDQGGSLRTKAIYPLTPNAHTLGTSSLAWAGGFTQSAFTVTSDERHKTQPLMLARGSLDSAVSSDARMMGSPSADAILDAWSEVDFVRFKYLDRVEMKGEDSARWHFGVVAQRAVEAFERHGLDAFAFGFACYDEWDDQDEVIEHHDATPALFDRQGNLIQPEREAYSEIASPAIKAGSKYGIRYEEALVLEAALQRRNYEHLLFQQEALSMRIDALETK